MVNKSILGSQRKPNHPRLAPQRPGAFVGEAEVHDRTADSAERFTDLSIYLSICPSIYLPIYLSIYLFLFLFLSVSLFLSLSISVYIYPSIYLDIEILLFLADSKSMSILLEGKCKSHRSHRLFMGQPPSQINQGQQ